MCGRCSPVSGPFRSGQIGAALGGKLPFAACLAVALHWRWRRKKFYQSVCQTVELRVRSDGDPDEVGRSRAGEMPDEYSALTQCRRQGLAGVARVADEDEVSAGRQDIEPKLDQSRGQALPISDDGRSLLLEISLVLVWGLVCQEVRLGCGAIWPSTGRRRSTVSSQAATACGRAAGWCGADVGT